MSSISHKKAAENGMTCRPIVLTLLNDEKPHDRAEVKNHVLKCGFKVGTYFSTIAILLGKDPRPNRQIVPPHIKSTNDDGGMLTVTKTGLKWLAEYEAKASQ